MTKRPFLFWGSAILFGLTLALIENHLERRYIQQSIKKALIQFKQENCK